MESIMGAENMSLRQENISCLVEQALFKHNCCFFSCRAQLPRCVSSVMPISMKKEYFSRGEHSHSRRLENVEGEFYVDQSCIDCDACRWLAPDNFTRIGKMSAVSKQPSFGKERTAMLQALLCCPTQSIHTSHPLPDFLDGQSLFPLAIPDLLGVYHCGYHCLKSDGATPFLITSPEGNVLVDSPRYTERLAQDIQKLGGVRYMFLSHLHDAADHAQWQSRFQCDRVMHICDIMPDTFNVEMMLEGTGPWNLGRNIDLIYTPGHTLGSVCLLYKPLKALFSGDHVGLSSTGDLTIWPDYCQYSVKQQIESLSALLSVDFEWILPGHARKVKFDSIEQKNAAISNLVKQLTDVYCSIA